MSDLDGKKNTTIEHLVTELEEAGLHVHQVELQRSQDRMTASDLIVKADSCANQRLHEVEEQRSKEHAQAADLLLKAGNRVKDATNVYNGIARRLEEAMQKIRASAPPGTVWHPATEGSKE